MFEKVDLIKLIGEEKKNDPRVLDWLQKDIDDASYVLVGYPDDEGIINNGGRKGAKSAPDQIRKYFYKMRPSIIHDTPLAQLYDYGNLKIDKTLAQRQNTAITFIERILDQGKTVIGLGGGHDYGYVDGKSFLKFCSDSTQKPLVINFDAHLDVRNMDFGITSGTPFFRLLEEDVFDFVEIGIQEQCNTKAHYDYVKSKGGHVLFLNDLYHQGQFSFEKFLSFFSSLKIKDTTCFISVDIDSFSNAFAPGCSQAFATGLQPESFFMMLEHIIQNYYVRMLGIYEVSPDLDFDDHTSKLAALIAYKFINLKQKAKFKK